VGKEWQNAPKRPGHAGGYVPRVVLEWRRQEARETLREISRQEGLDWLVREVLSMIDRQD
jgi:hypothetical protein